MKNGFKVIVDATNLNYKKRIEFLKRVCPRGEEIVSTAVVIATSYKTCLKRNSERDRVVPEDVIKRMRENFNFPLFQEGFYDIEIVYNDDYTFSYDELEDMPHDNPYHSESVLEHCNLAYMLSEKCDREIRIACKLHDIGKLETKTFVNCKGEKTEISHYYDHENVGTYNAMFNSYIKSLYNVDQYEAIEILQLINWHMLFHRIGSEKSINKYNNFLGQNFMNKLRIINFIDKQSR